jgi:nicotinate-nucleotide adenylyltransferase
VGVGGARPGVLGGAFDPPHLGHLALAQGGRSHFGLDRLLVRVMEHPGHKHVSTPARVRLDLVRLAFAEVPGVEIALDPHARTVDSLEALALPDPVFLLGADEFADFLSWKEPDRVLELTRLGVGMRPGVPRDWLEDVLVSLSRPDRVELFEIEPHDVSSAQLRALAAGGRPLDGFVPAAVAERIRELDLYRAA